MTYWMRHDSDQMVARCALCGSWLIRERGCGTCDIVVRRWSK